LSRDTDAQYSATDELPDGRSSCSNSTDLVAEHLQSALTIDNFCRIECVKRSGRVHQRCARIDTYADARGFDISSLLTASFPAAAV
jgi:hypothetical protein